MIIVLLVSAGCTNTPTRSADTPILELNTDHPGADISTIPLNEAKAKLCSDACRYNDRCVAWTYVKPGVIDAQAHCRIKSEVTAPQRSSCCVSGLK
jgi:hypothetical protein